jgi:hypothetical protein
MFSHFFDEASCHVTIKRKQKTATCISAGGYMGGTFRLIRKAVQTFTAIKQQLVTTSSSAESVYCCVSARGSLRKVVQRQLHRHSWQEHANPVSRTQTHRGAEMPRPIFEVKWNVNILIQKEIKRRLDSGNACYHSVLVSCLKTQKLKFKTAILPVVLYGFETWSLPLREKHILRVFGPTRDEVTGGWFSATCTLRHV